MPQNRHKTGFRGPSPDVGKATQFQPGQSPNPGGRPKRKPVTDVIVRLLDEPHPRDEKKRARAELIAAQLIDEAIYGKASTYAAKEVMDRVEGKVPVPLMGVDGAPIDITIVSKMARPKRGKKNVQ